MKIFENLDINDLDEEIWKDVLEYEDLYQVSNLGRVKSFIKWKGTSCRILKQIKDGSGHLSVHLYKNKKRKNKYVHRLIYETFKEKLKKDYVSHHIDEEPENNICENLESKENGKHTGYHRKGKKHSEEARKKISKNHADISGKNNPNFGKNMYGENTSNHKLNNKKVIQIKMLFKLGFKNREISDIFEVCEMTIYHIRIGKTWSHIKLEKI